MNYTTPFYTRVAHILVSLICLFYLAIIGETILAPLLFALLFSILLLPLANFFECRLKLSRTISSAIVLLSLIIFISALVFLLINQLSDLTADIPAFKTQILNATLEIQNWISNSFHIDNSKQLSYVNSAANQALSKGTAIVGSTLLSISSIMLFLVFTFLYTFFILLYRHLLYNFTVSLFNDKHTVIINDAITEIQYIVKKYIVGLFIQMLIVTTLACTAFEIIGIKYAFLLGLVTGIFNIIPYVGIFTAMLLSSLVTFATMGTTNVIFVIGSIIGIHLIDSNYLMPKIVGSKVKINPLVALLGLVAGELIWGISGMFLSIPVIAIFKVIFDRVDGLKPWGTFLGQEDKIVETKANAE